MKEIWQDIIGYEGLYQISNIGRVKSTSLTLCRILKASADRKGYLRVQFSNKGVKSKVLSLHRQVAIYFIPNPDNKPEVNHKNGVKSDCRAINLEWCTRGENQLHAYRTGLKKPAKSCRPGKWNSRSKPVIQIFDNGDKKLWEGIRYAAISLGLSPGNVWAACHGKLMTCGGFKWELV